jgi:hypothetical protein
MKPINNEKGAVLVVSLIVMGILTVIGTAITMMSSIELNIARNEKMAKSAFCRAEDGRVIAAMALQSSAWGTEYSDGDNFEGNADIIIKDGDFMTEVLNDSDSPTGSPDVEMTGTLLASADVDRLGTAPLPGAAAEFGSGYEGAGTSSSLQVFYQIDSIGYGPAGAVSQVIVEYRLIPQ